MEVAGPATGSAPSPQSEAVTNELQELSLQPAPNLLPLRERKNVLQLKLQQRRTREELVSQGIMPPLKSPAAFHEQRRSLERARTEDYLKRKIRSRPERSELVRMHILEETNAEPSLQAKQLQLKRARLADDLNDKISHRPGPIELVHKNILPVLPSLQNSLLDSPKGAGGESSSLDEDSSDALSPDQLTNHDSPLGSVSQLSPCPMLTQNGDMSPTQFLTQAPPPPPPPPPPPSVTNGSDSSPPQKLTNGTATLAHSRPAGQTKAQSKSGSDRPPQRPKKPKDNKPKIKKLKYHQYIPPDQKADKEPPPLLDSSYAKILQQQQLFLQLQILNQQQQHYNYHTILPAPPKPPAEQSAPTTAGASPSRSVPTTTAPTPSSQSGASRQSQTPVGGAKPGTLPAKLDEFKVAELKQELKLRGLTVSGTKNDLLERLRNYQEQNGGGAATTAVSKHGASTHTTTTTTSTATVTATTVTHQSGESGTRIPSFSLSQTTVPGRVMRFGSTSSSPPVSPCPSDRSLAGMSPDETSSNGDMFGEMVSSPLTQLTLHPSPQNSSSIQLPSHSHCPVKEENQGCSRSSCSLSRPSPTTGPSPTRLKAEPSAGTPMDTSSQDKDQMLQEKDKQIEELTRMLRQKQKLVETLRSQLEQGKMAGKDGGERNGTAAPEVKVQTTIKASAIQPPTLPNGMLVRIKKEPETAEESMEGVTDEAQGRKLIAQTQCSQETLQRLQQIHRLQIQQAELQKQQQQPQLKRQVQTPSQQQKTTEAKPLSQRPQQSQQKTEAQILLQQQQQLHQLIIQQTQQKQLLAQQKVAQQKLAQQNQLKQTPNQLQQAQQNHQRNLIQLKQVQNQTQALTVQKAGGSSQASNKKQQKVPQKQPQVTAQQVTPISIGQQNGTNIPTQTISLDLLKANGAPTLVIDGNGNHYLIALTNHTTEGQNGLCSLGKTNGRITLQRLQSTPSKLPSQTAIDVPSTVTQSKDEMQPEPDSQPIKKVQKAGLHLDTNGLPEPSLSISAPPSLQPFTDDASDSESQSAIISSLKREDVCPPYDRHTLFTPPSPKPTSSISTQRPKENGLSNEQMDDLFDILLKSGEICGFKANPDPSLAHLHSDPPSPSSPPSPLHLSPPTPPTASLIATSPRRQAPAVDPCCAGSVRLEDFLESATGAPLLGMEQGADLTLMEDLHSQMLSTPGILDHQSSPMDTSELGFSSAHTAGLDFGDPNLDSMDWLDISMAGSAGGGGPEGRGGTGGGDGGTSLAPLAPHTPPSVFSADFLDSTDLQLHWDSCL